jgi:hypothetical protein
MPKFLAGLNKSTPFSKNSAKAARGAEVNAGVNTDSVYKGNPIFFPRIAV